MSSTEDYLDRLLRSVENKEEEIKSEVLPEAPDARQDVVMPADITTETIPAPEPEIPAVPDEGTAVEPEMPVEPEIPVVPETAAEPEIPMEPEIPVEPAFPPEPGFDMPEGVEPEEPFDVLSAMNEIDLDSLDAVPEEAAAEPEMPVEPEIPAVPDEGTVVEPEIPLELAFTPEPGFDMPEGVEPEEPFDVLSAMNEIDLDSLDAVPEEAAPEPENPDVQLSPEDIASLLADVDTLGLVGHN